MGKWNKNKEKFETLIECLNENFQKYIKPLMDLIFEGIDGEEVGQPLQFEIPRTNLNLVEQMTRMLDSILDEDEPVQEIDAVEFIYIFCIVWSLGACLKPDARRKFEDFLRKISGRVFPPSPLFDNYYDWKDSKNFIAWEKLVTEYIPPADRKFSKILVPTVDTKRFSYIIKQHINEKNEKRPCMFVGHSGTAKSVIISSFLYNDLNPDQYMRLVINFSSRTTSADLQVIAALVRGGL